jgi:Tol biopolymer transport system component
LGTAVFGGASWSPAGDGIIIDSEIDEGYTPTITQVSEVAIDGGTPHLLLTVPGVGPAFSPDGSQIAYVGLSGGLVIADSDGTYPRRLTSTSGSTKGSDYAPSFSPDGSRLAFGRSTSDPSGSTPGTSGIWLVNADGTDLHRLTSGSPYTARWSPDGSRLMFFGPDDGLWTIGVDGTGLSRINAPCDWVSAGQPCLPDDQIDADWSPDGSRIVFHGFHSGLNSLRVMNADGSGSVRTIVSGSGEPDLYESLDWGMPPMDVP